MKRGRRLIPFNLATSANDGNARPLGRYISFVVSAIRGRFFNRAIAAASGKEAPGKPGKWQGRVATVK
jgi:hypothetical protein